MLDFLSRAILSAIFGCGWRCCHPLTEVQNAVLDKQLNIIPYRMSGNTGQFPAY